MIHWILGAAGTGKTHRLLQEAARAANEGQKVLILVPEQYSLEMEKALLRRLDAVSALRVEVYSFTRLCEEIFRRLGGGAMQIPGPAAEYLMMHLALDEVKGELTCYRPKGQNGAQVAALAGQMEQFRAAGISPQDLKQAGEKVSAEAFSQKLSELSLLYETYDSLLAGAFGSAKSLQDHALQRFLGTGLFSGYTVFVDSFKGFMAAEFALLEELMRTASSVTFALCCDSLFDQSGEYGMFAPVYRTAARLMELARKNHIPVEKPVVLTKPVRFHKPGLRALQEQLFSDLPQPKEKADGVCLSVCREPYEEMRWTAAAISHLVRRGVCRYRDIAVIGRDLDRYIQPSAAAFGDYGIPYFLDRRFDVSVQPLAAAVLSLLEAARTRFRSDDVFALIKTGLLGFTPEETALLEDYAFVWDITGARWEEPFVWNPSGFGAMGEKDRVRLQQVESLRQRLMGPLLSLRPKIVNCTGRGLASSLYGYLKESGILDNLKAQREEDPAGMDDQQVLFDGMMDLWDQYAVVLGKREYPLADHCELMRLVLSTADLGQIPQTLDMVTVGAAHRIRPHGPKYVFVIGANEDVFPALAARKGILSESEEEELAAVGLEVADPFEERVMEERYYAYAAMTAASHGLFISWSQQYEGSPLAPSVLVREVRKILPGVEERSGWEEPALYYALNPKTALGAFGRMTDRTGGEGAAFAAYLQNGPLAQRSRCMLAPSKPQEYRLETEETAKKLFGFQMRISPSKVDRFHQCRFAYFCERGLGVRKPRKAQLSPMESGTVVHYVLQQITAKHPGKALCALSEEECLRLVRRALEDYLQDSMGGQQDKTARFRYLFGRMANTLVRLVMHLAKEFSVSDFAPVAFELPIARDSQVTPLKLTVPGGSLWIEGIVDRVDVMEKNGKRYVRVVDYKTGTKEFDFSDVYHGLNLQMLIYLFSICQNGKDQLAGAIPAGVLYMPGKVDFIRADRDAGEKEMESKQRKALKMNGLILAEPMVLAGMEAQGAGVFIPAKLKDGQIDAKSSVATLEELGKLKNYVETLLGRMAQSLWQGEIGAMPLVDSGFNPCQWCDYRSLCGREEDGPCNPRQKLNREEFFEQIGGGENVGTAVDGRTE